MGLPEGLLCMVYICTYIYMYIVYVVFLNIALVWHFYFVSQPVFVKCIKLLELNHTKLRHTDLIDYPWVREDGKDLPVLSHQLYIGQLRGSHIEEGLFPQSFTLPNVRVAWNNRELWLVDEVVSQSKQTDKGKFGSGKEKTECYIYMYFM